MKRGVIISIVIAIILLLIIGFLIFNFLIKPDAKIDSDKNTESSIEKNLETQKPIKWAQMPIKYYLDTSSCGKTESARIMRAILLLENSTNNKVIFTNVSQLEEASLKINCSLIKNCYKSLVFSDSSYNYPYEVLCPYEKSLVFLDKKENTIKSASLEFIGLYEYLEGDGSNEGSGFMVGTCGFPLQETRGLLIALGYSRGYTGYKPGPEIYSYDWDEKDYSVLNSFEKFIGISSYSPGSCLQSRKDLDSWIISDLVKIYSDNFSVLNYYSECKNLPMADAQEWCQLNNSVFKKDPNGCAVIIDLFKKDGCYQSLAISLPDSNYCAYINDSGIKDSCYFLVASRKADSSACGGIGIQERKDWCFQNVSIASSNPSTCGFIKDDDSRDYCYEQTAFRTKSEKFCNSTLDGFGYCSAFANNSVTICSSADVSYKPYCFTNLAIFNNNVSFCDKIVMSSTSYYDRSYLYGCYATLAVNTKDSSVCNKIVNPEYITEAQFYRDGCYANYAYEREDISACSNVQDPNLKDECYWWLSKKENNPSLCSLIRDPSWAYYCANAPQAI